MDAEKLRLLAEYIEKAESIVFFGGAGVSTESGVPDFRSKDGLYNQHDVRFDGYPPEYLLSHSCLVSNPKVFFEFYRQKMNTGNIQPNAAHRYLAALEERGKLKAVVTQNIDGLHQKAGSRNVCEIHGTTQRNYCMQCGRPYDADYIFRSDEPVPHCSCGGIIRCDVTLYEEALPEDAVRRAVSAIGRADMLIIGGTSLSVYPAAYYINYFSGRYLAVINKEHLGRLPACENTLEINEPIGEVFGALMAGQSPPEAG